MFGVARVTREAKPLFGVANDHWVRMLVSAFGAVVMIALAWSFRVENRIGSAVTDDQMRSEVKEHVIELRATIAAQRNRVEQLERGASKQEQVLLNIQRGIEEIKDELRRRRERDKR